MFIAFLYFYFTIIFFYLAKCIHSFNRALSTVKNCADCLFEYFEILLFVRLTYGISRGKSNIFNTCYSLLFIEAKKLLKQPQDICMVYREGVIGESIARKWFAKFKNGNFDINNMPHSRRSFEFDKDHLKALLEEESCQRSCELAEKMNYNQKTILNYFHSMGFAEKLGVWVPHELSENNKKLLLNCFSTSCPPSSNTQSQIALFVPNCHGR